MAQGKDQSFASRFIHKYLKTGQEHKGLESEVPHISEFTVMWDKLSKCSPFLLLFSALSGICITQQDGLQLSLDGRFIWYLLQQVPCLHKLYCESYNRFDVTWHFIEFYLFVYVVSSGLKVTRSRNIIYLFIYLYSFCFSVTFLNNFSAAIIAHFLDLEVTLNVHRQMV